MTLLEIFFRVISFIKNGIEKQYYLKHPVFLKNMSIENINLTLPDFKNETLQLNAENLLNDSVVLFGKNYVLGNGEWDFHLDQDSGIRAPKEWGKGIDYRDSKIVGNIKTLWELNRFTYLFPLTYEYKRTGDKVFLNKIKELVLLWIDQNPFLYGINWCSSLENAIRTINWVIALSAIEDDLSQPDKEKILNTIYQNLWFIRNNLSLFSSANNHLIGELAGLYIGCLILPQTSKIKKWRSFSYNKLIKEMNKQFYSEGVNKEQAFYYQHTVLDIYLIISSFAKQNGDSIEPFQLLLEKGISSLMSFSYDGKNLPKIGDEDGAITINMDQEMTGVYASLFNTYNLIWNNDSSNTEQKSDDIKSHFFLMNIGRREKQQYTLDRLGFNESGYYLFKEKNNNNNIFLLYDCGPIGYGSLAAHGHADANSIFFSVDSTPVFIDPGTYAYHDLPEWRNYFRSTRAHNTLSIDQRDQSQNSGLFMWGKKAKTVVTQYKPNHSITGKHNGYSKTNEKQIHSRTIDFSSAADSIISIIDTIESNRMQNIEIYFHVNNKLKCCLEQKKVFIELNHKSVHIEWPEVLKCKIITGDTDPILGWQSDIFYQKEKCSTIVLYGEVAGNLPLLTKISILNK